jgi:hypothetical protein
MKKAFAFLLISFLTIAALPAFAQVRIVNYTDSGAQNLAGKKGIGFHNMLYRGFNGAEELPVLSVRYWIDDNVGVEGELGYTTGKHSDIYYFGGRITAIVNNYKTLNLYAVAFGGAGNADNNRYDEDISAHIFNIGAGLGVEWFVLDNLSISSECGLVLMSNSNSDIDKSFGFYGDFVPRAGVRLYF